jgi:uncharacterized RDD family membrane protein YckC
MATCASCNAEIVPGTRWCGICHPNAVKPEIGRLASPGKRLAAYVVDLFVPLVAIALIVFVVGMSGSTGGESSGMAAALLGVGLLVAYVVWAFVLFGRGTTPGKRMLGMRVIKEDGSHAGFFTMLVREWIGKLFISGMVFSLGFVWILFDPENQAWHDKLVSTYVVG